jgi:hypothetical protein
MRHPLAVFTVAIAFLGLVTLTAPAVAQSPANGSTGAISGTVTSASGLNIGSAEIVLSGISNADVQTSGDGTFSIPGLVPGVYSLTVRKASFVSVTRTDVVVAPGDTVEVSLTLQPTSFSQLQDIGRVSATRGPVINTSAASVVNVPGSTFSDQGLQQVTAVLNQIPGILTTISASGTNLSGAFANTTQIPQIRGALPYETESLIDGHPVSVGINGFFSPLYVNPNQLQSVEVAKGPGSMPTDISYAVGGSVNYVTLAPTLKPHESITFDQDSYGGLSTNARATGTTLDGRLGYAVAYGIDGTPGPFHNFAPVQGVPIEAITGTSTANGVPLCGTFAAQSTCIEGNAPSLPGYYATFSPTYAVTTCCYQLSSQYLTRSELAKLQYNFSTQSSLTVAYLGGQSTSANEQNYSDPQQLFAPPAGYTGSIPAGASLPFATDSYSAWQDFVQQGLLESEFRTSVGPASLLFRYYTGANNNNLYIGNSTPNAFVFTANTWGGLPIGPGGSEVYFNGTPVTYSAVDSGLVEVNLDHFDGMSAEADLPMGNNIFTFSADRTRHDSVSGYNFAMASNDFQTIPDGASQALTTYLAKGQFQLGPQLSATLGNYFVTYQTHFTPDGGVTWSDASHSLYLPRLAFVDRPAANTSIRLSLGSSFAPPYLALVNTQGGAPVPNIEGAPTNYTETVNTGNISPETAFGYDLGVDKKIATDTIVSSDIYLTTLHGQFLTSTIAAGNYTGTGQNLGLTAPLYLQSTINLGSSRYDGLEFSVRKAPAAGFGYTAQGSLIRAYVYNLPAGFYDTANGAFTTNLGVIPGVNFMPSGEDFNGMTNGGRIPYATGYAEVNYRTRSGSLFLVNTQYNGNNNAYNVPAFFTVNASARFAIGKSTSLQASVFNLTGVYNQPYAGLQDGIPVPLANGQLGAVPSINVGPTTFHLILSQSF